MHIPNKRFCIQIFLQPYKVFFKNILKKQNVIDSERKTDSGIKRIPPLEIKRLFPYDVAWYLFIEMENMRQTQLYLLHHSSKVRWDICDHFMSYIYREHHIYIGKYI